MADTHIANSSVLFTYKWQIENYEFCHHEKNQVLESPEFSIDALDGSKWQLKLYPRGKLTSNGDAFCNHSNCDAFCNLSNCDGSKSNVQYHLGIVVADSITSRKTKMVGQCRVYPFFLNNYLTLSESNKDILLQSGTLTIQCVILNSTNEFVKVRTRPNKKRSVLNKYGLGHTSIGTQVLKRSFEGVLNNQVYERILVGYEEAFSLNLKMKRQSSDQSVTIQVHKIDRTLSAYSKCNVTFYEQNSIARKETYEHYFLRNRTDFQIINSVHNHYVGASSSENIKIDFTFEISDGTVCSKTENLKNKLPNLRKSTENADMFLSMYIDQKFCDFTLVSSDGKAFKVHKAVLYSASPYFKSMLEHDTKESQASLATLQNTDSQTLDLLLRHIYSAQLNRFHSEIAMKVFASADEYALLSLKNHCSILIATQLSFSNFLDVLVLADMHSEWYLKMSVRNFVMNHVAEVLASEAWSVFAGGYPRLASEVLQWVTVEFKEKLNIA